MEVELSAEVVLMKGRGIRPDISAIAITIAIAIAVASLSATIFHLGH